MPAINIANDYLAFDNTESVTVTNPDGSATTTTALQEGVTSIPVDLAGGEGISAIRTFCVWHLFRAALNGFIPQFSCKLEDKEGRIWYAGRVDTFAWGTRYVLECEAQSGLAVDEVNPL